MGCLLAGLGLTAEEARAPIGWCGPTRSSPPTSRTMPRSPARSLRLGMVAAYERVRCSTAQTPA